MLPVEPVPSPSGAPLMQGASGALLPACARSARPGDAGSAPCRLPASQLVQNTVLDRAPASHQGRLTKWTTEAKRGVLAALALCGDGRGAGSGGAVCREGADILPWTV